MADNGCVGGNCNNAPKTFIRNAINVKLAAILQNNIIMGNGRLKEPLYNGEINILDVIDAVGSQSCIRVKNYQPDKKNKHLAFVSLGPSYLEAQLSRAVDDATKKSQIPPQVSVYLREQIGLNKKKPKKLNKQGGLRQFESIEKIANVISENIYYNNGLI